MNNEVAMIFNTKYPVILVHGFFVRDILWFKAFGKLDKKIHNEGFKCHISKVDAFGTIENNAQILKTEIENILREEKVDKVIIIAHSKGGLDSRYMISKLGMENYVDRLITICTPHRGSEVADQMLALPKRLLKFCAFFINGTYRILGDKKPKILEGGKQLTTEYLKIFNEDVIDSEKVKYESYGAILKEEKDDLYFSLLRKIFKKINEEPNDGLVKVSSAKYGNYKGLALEESITHRQIINYIPSRKIYMVASFYFKLLSELN